MYSAIEFNHFVLFYSITAIDKSCVSDVLAFAGVGSHANI